MLRQNSAAFGIQKTVVVDVKGCVKTIILKILNISDPQFRPVFLVPSTSELYWMVVVRTVVSAVISLFLVPCLEPFFGLYL